MKAAAAQAFDSFRKEVRVMQRAMLIPATVAVLSVSMPAGVSAQSSDIVCQPLACGGNAPRKLTDADKPKFQDPFSRLVLSQRPTVRKLTEIETLILGTQGATRRVFVVDEEIQSTKQPASRRSVVDFVGQNNGLELGSKLFLSFFFSSSAVPDSPDLEVLAWDDVNGTYNYYKLQEIELPKSNPSDPPVRERLWVAEATSRNVDALTPAQRSGTCLACHANGVPVMKELLFPWNNWHSTTSRIAYLSETGPANQRWPVRTDEHFKHFTEAQTLEGSIQTGINLALQRRFEQQVVKQGDGKPTVANGRLTLRPLFETTEINLISAGASQLSGLHPLTGTPMNGPLVTIQIPDSFFLQSEVLGPLGIGDAKQFKSVARIKPADYTALVQNSGVKIRTRALGTVAGDTNFAWFTPEQGFVDTAWIAKLVNENVATKAFAAAAAAADLEMPIFSEERAKLLRFIPASFTVTPGEAHPDALTRSVIAAIDAAAPPTGSVAAQFGDTLKAPDPVAVVRDRVKAYKDRIAGLLADSAPVALRTAEQQRLYSLLLDRRRAFINHPLFGNLVESGALIPLP
jgi:hypothetical protein